MELKSGDFWGTGEADYEREEQGKNFQRVERTYGLFCRIITLPGEVVADKIRAFVTTAFETILSRSPTAQETVSCKRFLQENSAQLRQPNLTALPAGGAARRPPAADVCQRARENLLLALYSHNDLVTTR